MNKYNLYFTLDYEIHGNGDGNPYELMVEPTYRLMNLLEKYGQKLTIMADVAEILCFKRYAAETGRDDYHVAEIEAQLCEAITSVFKGGVQGGNVCYDYREAHDNLFAYPASVRNINEYDAEGKLVEMPIYTEMRPFWDFVSVIRVFRMIRAKFHKHKHAAADKVGNERVKELTQAASRDDNRKSSLKSFFRLSPLKMDFNQVSARGIKRMMRNVMRRVESRESRVWMWC